MTREGLLRFVRRGRARLEAMRLLRAAARGALWGGASGLVLLCADRLGLHLAPWLPWACCGAGAVLFAAIAAGRARVGLPAAALLLDEKLRTEERIATVTTRDPGPHTPRLLRELKHVRRFPRLPLPRELSLVPAALFVLFLAGLLPRANGAVPAAAPAPPRTQGAAGAAGAQPPPDVTEAVARLARGLAPTPAEQADLAHAIDQLVLNPDEREAAKSALARAVRGDGAAAKEVAASIDASGGGQGRGEENKEEGAPGATPATRGPVAGGGTTNLYPEHQELLLDYRRALAELAEEKDR